MSELQISSPHSTADLRTVTFAQGEAQCFIHHPTLLGTIRSHWRTLKLFGDPQAAPFVAVT